MARGPKGHSNVIWEQAKPLEVDPANVIMVPIIGGATIDTVRPLPPLSLSKAEWTAIGALMRWL